MQPLITLCICTYDRYDLLPAAIKSAIEQSLPSDDFEILIVDNSPDRRKAESFSARCNSIKNLKYILAETPGLSNARNIAAYHARAPVIAYMDDDAIASPEWAEELLRAYDGFGPKAMVVGGRVDPIWSTPRPSWMHDGMLGNLSVVNWGGDTRIASPDEWVAGTNISFRVSAIIENGGFSANLGRVGSGAALLSNEEINLVAAIRGGGGEVIYAPNARVSHLVDLGRLSRHWFRKRAAWQAVSDFLLDPDRSVEEARLQWPNLIRYFNSLPPHERTVRGLVCDTEDAEQFDWQTGAVYMLTTLMLAGFEGVELD